MKVLIYGGGAREHALAWKIKQSSLLTKLYLSKPNDGFASLGELLDADNYAELAQKAQQTGIDLLVVGPEDPLVGGIVDEFQKLGIPAIGATTQWAMLEGSKSYAKDFMARNNIPTAKYELIEHPQDIPVILDKFSIPVVLKADGLAAGKGVVIANTREEAENTLKEFLQGKFGQSSGRVVVEEFLIGEEISLIALWDGNTLLPLIPARDYKKLNEGNKGPNTGGMGAYCPVSLTADEYNDIENYIKLLADAFKREGAQFTGIVYSGLILTHQGVKVLEYNMRFGDPETQPLLMHMESDLLEVFQYAAAKELDKISLKWKPAQTFCVVVAAQGYPESPNKGAVIKNIEQIIKNHDVTVFYAGVKKQGDSLTANGGRVLSLCQSGPCAQKYIYDAASELDFADKIYRKDIGEVSLHKEECKKDEGCCNNCGV